MPPTLHSLDVLAAAQRSLVTREQLLGAGYGKRRIEGFLRSGTLRSVQPGVYATVGAAREWRQDLLARVLSHDDGALASHQAAARLWDYTHRPEYESVILLESESSLGMRGVRRTTILPEEDRSVRQGIPCTTFERTLCDCSTLLSPFQLGRVLDDGLRRGDASIARLARCAARLDSGPGRKLSVVKELLRQRDAGFDPGGSGSELDVLAIIRGAGLPDPVQQYAIKVDGHPYELDFAWPEHRVFAEYYGLAVHSGASAVAHDSERLTALVGQGWRPLVFTDRTPDGRIVREIAKALSTASPTEVDRRKSA